MQKWLCAVILLTVGGCNDTENDALSQSQACLDQVTAANPTAASACMAPIQGLDSQQANILKCSILFVAGGLTTPKVANAYLALQNSTANKEALFITTLALNPASLAQTAASYCNKTGESGYIYIAQLSVVGSSVASVIPGYDPSSNTPPTTSQIQTALTNCESGGCDDATIGAAVQTVGKTYCATASANPDVCSKINQAIAASDGSAASIAQQIYPLLNQ